MLDQINDKDIARLAARQRGEEQQHTMSFLDHVEILRWHLIRSVIAILVVAIVAFIFPEIVFGKIIFGPSKVDFPTFKALCKLSELINSDVLCIQSMPFKLQSRQMSGQFTMHIMSSFIIGFIVGFPYVFWEIWRFIKPGLKKNEKGGISGTVLVVSTLFIAGILFGYYIVAPLAVNFLANYSIDPSISNEFDITSYVSTVTMMVMVCGLTFQLPIVIYYLAKFGIVTPDALTAHRKHAAVAILFVSAILTPPDVTSQILVAIPIFFLYEIGIVVAKVVYSKRK